MLNSATKIKRRDQAIAEDVVLFFKELTKRLDQHEGQLNKDAFLNMSLLAANNLPEDSRTAIVTFIDSQPNTFLQNLAKKSEDKTQREANPVQQAMVAAPVLFAIRKTAIPAIFKAAMPLAVNLLLPGSGPVVSKILVPCVELSGEFAMETARGFVQSCEKTPTTVIHNFLGDTLQAGWHRTTQGLTKLLNRSSSSVVEIGESSPSLLFTEKTGKKPSLIQHKPSASVKEVVQLAKGKKR